jgi:hypothetical protein
MDLTQKLWERPTPKFSEAVASCGRPSRRILIAGTEHGRLSSSRCEEALELPLAFQKKMAAVWAGHKSNKLLISVYQHTCCSANLSDNPPKKSGHTS